MNESTIISLLGALAGLLPVAFSQAIAWFNTRSEENKLKRSLELAKGRIEFLDSWLRLQEKLLSPDALKDIRIVVSNELFELKQTVDNSTSSQPKDEQKAIEELPFIQRFFLAYKPLGVAGWAFRFVYYMLLGILIAKVLDDVRMGKFGVDASGVFSFGKVFGEVFGVTVATGLFLFPVWYITNIFDLKAEKSGRRPYELASR